MELNMIQRMAPEAAVEVARMSVAIRPAVGAEVTVRVEVEEGPTAPVRQRAARELKASSLLFIRPRAAEAELLRGTRAAYTLANPT